MAHGLVFDLSSSVLQPHLWSCKHDIQSASHAVFVLYVMSYILINTSRRMREYPPWWWKQHVSPNLWYLSIKLHGVTSQQTVVFIVTGVRTTYITKPKFRFNKMWEVAWLAMQRLAFKEGFWLMVLNVYLFLLSHACEWKFYFLESFNCETDINSSIQHFVPHREHNTCLSWS
jgi:hypothetical protein